jgi:hypothetical protein
MKHWIVKGILVVLVAASSNVQARKKPQYFNQLEFQTNLEITHPIMTANFVGDDNQEILVIGLNEKSEKVMEVYAFDINSGEYASFSQIVIPSSTIAFDLLSNSNGKEKALLLDTSGLSLVNFESKLITPLAQLDSIYLVEQPQFVTRKNLVKDLNGDGLDDIHITDFKKLKVLIQRDDGEFTANNLPIGARVDMGRNEISFSEEKFYLADTNFDQRADMMVIEDTELKIYEQMKDGEFSLISNSIQLPEGVYGKPWWMVKGADGESVDQSNLKHKKIERIEDFNGDKITDLMVLNTQSSGVLDRENRYEIFYGENKEGVLTFPKEMNTQISAEGTLSGLQVIDSNKDGRQEILVSSFDIGVSQIIGALMSGSIDQDVFLFTLDADDKYQEEPLFSEEVDLNFSLSSGRTGQPVILAADLNGDGFKEIMLSANEKRLSIHTGDNSEDMFKSRTKSHRLVLPQDGSMLSVVDLNNDSKDEVIVRYGKQDEEELRKKIIILSAKL